MSWPLVKLADVCEINIGKTPARANDEYWGEGEPWLSISDMNQGLHLFGTKEQITRLAVKETGIKRVEPGTVLFSFKLSIGKIGIAMMPMYTNEAIAALPVLDPKRICSSYLVYALSWLDAESKTDRAVMGAILNKRKLAELEIPLPPLPEQKRIAAILDKADAIRRKRQQAIQLADDFLRAVFLDIFGDPVRNSKEWPVLRVDELCTIVRGSSPRPQGDPRFYGGSVPRLMVADLTRDGKLVTPQIDSLTEEGAKKSRPIEAGTVVMAVSGNVGLTSVLAINACIHDGFVAFNDLDGSRVRPGFLCELMMFLKSTHASRQAGAIFQNLTTSQIKEMEIPIPPLELQDKFLSISRKALDLYKRDRDELFESLAAQAFLPDSVSE